MTSNRVLLIAENYYPELVGISVYSTDLTRALSDAKYVVTVLTTPPHFPNLMEFENKNEELVESSLKADIDLIRLRLNSSIQSTILGRAKLEIRLFFLTSKFLLRKLLSREKEKPYDLIITYVPSLAMSFAAGLYAHMARIPIGVIFQDLPSRAFVQTNVRFGNTLGALLQPLESYLSKIGKTPVVVSQEMANVLSKNSKNSLSANVILNYFTGDTNKESSSIQRATFGLDKSDFILLYTGSIGRKQNLENLIQAATLIVPNDPTKIIIVGAGSKFEELRSMAQGLSNIKFASLVNDDDYSSLLKLADGLILSEMASLKDFCLPSKITAYFFSGRPVLAVVPKGGATANFTSGLSYQVEPGNPILLAEAISNFRMDEELRHKLARDAYNFAIQNLDKKRGRENYFNWISEILDL